MNLKSQLESLLLVAGRPLSLADLAKLLKTDKKLVEKTLTELQLDYQENKRGFNIINSEEKYQLTTAGENAELIGKFLKEEVSGELTQPSLEALTIIAYRQPIIKSEIDRIRGVNCSLILRNLLLRGLIEEKFDKQKQENYYSVSLDFIRHLGISDPSQLPDFDKLSSQESLAATINSDQD